jgi:hypothetical protein
LMFRAPEDDRREGFKNPQYARHVQGSPPRARSSPASPPSESPPTFMSFLGSTARWHASTFGNRRLDSTANPSYPSMTSAMFEGYRNWGAAGNHDDDIGRRSGSRSGSGSGGGDGHGHHSHGLASHCEKSFRLSSPPPTVQRMSNNRSRRASVRVRPEGDVGMVGVVDPSVSIRRAQVAGHGIGTNDTPEYRRHRGAEETERELRSTGVRGAMRWTLQTIGILRRVARDDENN